MNVHQLDSNGLIINTIVMPDGHQLQANEIDASIGGGRGWTYKLGVLSAPVTMLVVPNEITKFQAKAALLQNNLLDTLEALIAASGNRLYQMAWQDSTTFHRDSPLLKSFAAAANITDAQLDDMFIQASKIKV